MTAHFKEVSDKITQRVTLAIDRLIEQTKKKMGTLLFLKTERLFALRHAI